jgi:rod shape determining protein RodA
MRDQIGLRWRAAYAPVRHLDPVLIAATVLLVVFGLVAIFSAKHQQLVQQGLPTDLYVTRQLLAFGVGLVGMAAAASIDYRRIRSFTPLLYAGSLGLLLLVLLIGDETKGATSWITFGGFQFQPSELAKIAVILGLAAALADRRGRGLSSVLLVLAIVTPPLVLIVLQPDPGTGSILLFVAFVALLVQGTQGRWLALLAAAGVTALWGVLRLGLLEAHQQDRLTSFLNPGDNALARSINYNTDQSLIAIGSGQFTGKGLFQGTQTNLAYVPENHTDFIFTVIGEEFGFLGGMLLLGLFVVVIYRCLRVAGGARDRFGLLVASGVAGLLSFQLFVNVGMAVGIMPVIGIPLPFVSYGGTSLIATLMMVGLVLNIHMRRFGS